jgi:cellulose synthase/poly-beta-1,6-N-acetylglucosamine synthase-like glycosyltransferase
MAIELAAPTVPAGETLEQRAERAKRNKRILDAVALEQAKLRYQRECQARPDIWSNPNPLVSVRICTYNRPDMLVERAINSVLRQSYQNFEIVVVGDHAGSETEAALKKVGDSRIRYFNLPERPVYPRFPRFFWYCAGVYPMNKALAEAQGEWIAPLDDDDEFTFDHFQVLLSAAYQQKADVVYGITAAQMPQGWRQVGNGNLVCGQICSGAVMFSSRLRFIRLDDFAWLLDEPADWKHVSTMAGTGAKVAFLNYLVGIHHGEGSSIDDEKERRQLREKTPTPEEILADLEWMNGHRYLALA